MLLLGDCMDSLKKFPDNYFDAVVTDPPYGLKFMGKKWDYDVPAIEVWNMALRVLKPGGHVLSFGGARTYHRMVCAIEDAGFEIRDQIQWLYGSGFPKSHNLKDEWKGFGTALKPANEPICLARKPIEKGLTVAENVEKWGCGAINVDGSRIGTETITQFKVDTKAWSGNSLGAKPQRQNGQTTQTQGRWPANVLFDETAAEMLGQPSRFFYVAKASKRERNAGLEGMPNGHPTIKPIKLMEYLCRLITPPNGIILDPFMGSGSTGVAAHNLGFGFVGCEMNEEYLEIAKRRIENVSVRTE